MWKTKLKVVPSLFLVVNSISWFSLTIIAIMEFAGATSFERVLFISGSYFAALIFSAIIGATLFKQKLKERGLHLIWILSGGISCFLFYFFSPNENLFVLSILALILGASAGLGIPMSLSLFANQTNIDKRGRMGAVMFFVIQIIAASILLPLDGAGTGYQFLIFGLWRVISIFGLVIYFPREKKEERKTSLVTIIRERSFILYFLPWFMFTLVNFIEVPIFEHHVGPQIYNEYILATNIISSFSAIIAGFLCDAKGRKATGILGFVLLGLGYAFLSFFSGGPGSQLAQILYTVFDGTAWGILYVTFIFVVWGDLSEGSTREKYYLLGGMPFLFSGLIQVLVKPFVNDIPINTAFSLVSFFLFMAILPLLYAPESLPDRVMKNRDLSSYVNKALEKVQKGTGRDQKTKRRKISHEKKEETESERNSEDEKARKLAEKYY